MKCPKCGYNSFEHLDDCKKCGQDLTAHKAKFNLRGFFSAGQAAPPAAPEATMDEALETEETPGEESVDFGFDFLDEEEDQIAPSKKGIDLGEDDNDVSIEQPFGVDGETVPADEINNDDTPKEKKPEKGSEFSF